jgi:hypothetical protein
MRTPASLRYAAIAAIALAVTAGASWSISQAAPGPGGAGGGGKSSPIKEIMKSAMKGDDSLYKKVESGQGTKEEKAKLLAFATDLAKQEPPKGDKKGWQDKCAALIKACEAVNTGSPDGLKLLKAAGDCKGCHSGYKPMPPRR